MASSCDSDVDGSLCNRLRFLSVVCIDIGWGTAVREVGSCSAAKGGRAHVLLWKVVLVGGHASNVSPSIIILVSTAIKKIAGHVQINFSHGFSPLRRSILMR